ncbi:DUF3667 domain-containing protein [Prevotella sp. 10(H)]|uniref:DUF3667 domain-containing protein n=1 Tax=Prevotella sp. 10(H) TaxID=1158294 RepID=UPI0004A75F62|nr:DUF3667 domain-containing protein [Prevotella sp. 10(H)]
MAKHKIRKSKTCLNCGSFVHKHYCPHCGQENSESRQSFHHLFTHFVSDFLHYDSSFWRTIKYLFLYPGRLSIEFMNGKRKAYVNPFTLYIFISFLAFFIPSVLPDPEPKGEQVIIKAEIDEAMRNKDSLIAANPKDKITASKLDSTYRALSQEDQIISPDGLPYKIGMAAIEKSNDKHMKQKAVEYFIHNIPKTLFVYMPIFAFLLWLLHNKKKRYYFDSGVFTLHFFSVVLFSVTICIILSNICNWIGIDSLNKWFWTIMILYITFYFFKACYKFYGESRFLSGLISFALIMINTLMIILITALYATLVFYMVYVSN